MLDPQDTDGLEQDTVTLYQWAEMGLLGVLGSLIMELKDTPVWGTGELLALARKRRDIQRIVTTLEQKAPRLLATVVDEAYKLGATAAQAEVTAIPDEHKPTPQPHTPTDPRRYATDTMGKLTPLHRNIYRTTDDIWRRIVREATQKALTGKIDTFTAAQQAFTSMAREGLGYFVDSRGRRWGLDTYAEMAVRSAANEALRAGHWDELTASGIDLVVVSSHKNPAPVCAPYERKVLSLTGRYAPGTHTVDGRTVQVKATLQQAEAAGLHHPHCRHATSAYIPGYTNLKKTTPPDDDHKGYEATQKQRYLERQIRASRRMEQAALNEHDKAQAVARRKAYEKKLREHVREWDLPRRKHREQVRVLGDEVTF